MTQTFGASFTGAERLGLRAGPLSMDLDGGALRFVRWGGQEVLRGIYAAVRDPRWGTVPGRIEGLVVEAGADRFRVRFRASHREGPIAFDWDAVIVGEPDATIRYEMEGAARSSFLKNRVGLCVLHPIDECAGRPCEVERADGEVVRGVFPRFVAPQPVFLGVRAVRHEVAPGLQAEVRLLGDVFEMEDQRNWSDASYKTYSTPLALPYPAPMRAGDRVRQSATLVLRGEARPRPALVRDRGAVRARVDGGRAFPLPRLGLGPSTTSEPLTEMECVRLRSLRPDHVRVDLRPAAPGFDAALDRARELSRALDAPLEAALYLSDDAEADLRVFAEGARARALQVAVFLLFRERTLATSDGLAAQARPFLLGVDPEARLGGGADGPFADLNRTRPAAAELDQVSFALSPQVHARDDVTLLDNLASLGWIAESARAFVGSCPLALSPVTLRPRRAPGVAPDDPDARQAEAFGAGWTAGLLAAAAQAGFASLTLYEPTGPRGLIDAGRVHPVFPVLLARAEMREGVALLASCDAPRRVQVLAFREGSRTRALVFNLTREPQRVLLRGLPPGGAMSRVGGPRRRQAAPRTTEGYVLELGPQDALSIDAEGGR